MLIVALTLLAPARMRRVLTADNVAGAVLAVAALSAIVNVVELVCRGAAFNGAAVAG